MGFKVPYTRSAKLFTSLEMAKADGSYISELSKIEPLHLMILDEFGLQPLDASSNSILMEIIEDRHGNHSTIITSQVPVAEWHNVIGEQTIADAFFDRVVQNAHHMELAGGSLRKRQKTKSPKMLKRNK